MNIAVIEDNELESKELKSQIERILLDLIDHDIYPYSSVAEFEEANISFDLLVLDLILPDGNGLELARKIKQKGRKRA